ncbi:transposase [Streptomyces sp. NPDC096153]|uniref:IS110 family transposase n=1 Tax=Streptomyces sp. NPDC096153 TaxID=3155548 RepID=UPI00332A72A2
MTLGVDTHADVHVAAALDQFRRRMGTLTVPSTPQGYAFLESWAASMGTIEPIGLEGTGCHGAGLSRWMRQRGHLVEVNRSDRQTRRRRGMADAVDAEAAARAVQAGTAAAIPKTGDGAVEMIRTVTRWRTGAEPDRLTAVTKLAMRSNALRYQQLSEISG